MTSNTKYLLGCFDRPLGMLGSSKDWNIDSSRLVADQFVNQGVGSD